MAGDIARARALQHLMAKGGGGSGFGAAFGRLLTCTVASRLPRRSAAAGGLEKSVQAAP